MNAGETPVSTYIAVFWLIVFALVLVVYLYLSPTVRAEFFENCGSAERRDNGSKNT